MLLNDYPNFRSLDYMELVNNDRRGLWNVPYLSSCYLISSKILKDPATHPDYLHDTLDADMAVAQSLREKNVFMYVSNRANFGHLINPEKFTSIHLNNELWEMQTNRYIQTAQESLARKKFVRKIFKYVYLSLFIIEKLFLKSESLILFKLN